MSKIGGALPTWYWPEDVPRRIAITENTLDGAFTYRVRSMREEQAIVRADGAQTYGQVLEAAQRVGRGILAVDPDTKTVAVCEADIGHSLILLIGVLLTRKRVLMLDPSAPPATLARQLELSEAKTVLTTTGATAAEGLADIAVLASGALPDGDQEPPGTKDSRAAAVLFPVGEHVAVHSHFGFMAMSVSLATFVERLREMPYFAMSPLWTWEGLCAALAAMLFGTSMLPSQLSGGPAPPADLGESWALLLRSQADAIIDSKQAPIWIGRCRYVFVSTGSFRPRWREKLERRLGKPVLPLWGTAEVGPVLAAHPTWFPVESHGIPLVNVFVHPVDGSLGVMSDVPWEMLEQAEMGIETTSELMNYAGGSRQCERIRRPVPHYGELVPLVRTRTLASVDLAGVVTVLPTPEGVVL